METISIWAPSSTADDLDEIAEQWDRHDATKVKRSVPGREALLIGIAVIEAMDSQLGTRRTANMPIREKQSAARQGVIDIFSESRDSDES